MAHEFEVRVIEHIDYVIFTAGEEVIDTDDVVAFGEKSAAEM